MGFNFVPLSTRLATAAAPLVLLGCQSAAPPSAAPRSATYVVTADQAGSSVTVVSADSGRVVRTLPTTVGPHEAAASSDGRWVVVSNYGDGGTVGTSLLAIDGRTLQVEDTLVLGEYRRPHGMAFLPGDSLLLVTVELDSAVLVVRFPSGEIRSVLPTGQWVSHMLAAHPDGKRVYTANIVDASVSEMDIAGDSLIRTAPVGPMAEAIGITPDGSELWVGSNTGHTITVLDTETLSPIATMPAAGFPYRIVFTPDGSTGIVTQPEANLVRLFDVASHEETGTIPVTGAPAGIALSRDGSLAYVTRNEADSVAVVSLADRDVHRMLPAGPTPDGVVVLEGVVPNEVAETRAADSAPASVESDRWPPAVVHLDPAFKPIGSRTIPLGAAEAEIHVLADVAAGRVDRFYWIQFEGKPEGSAGRYDYSDLPHQVRIGDYLFDAGVRFGAYTEEETTTEPDTRTVGEILAATGHSFPAPMMRVRMATVDDSGLNELLVIYMESLAWSGVTESELEASESRWDEVSADLLRRAAGGLSVR